MWIWKKDGCEDKDIKVSLLILSLKGYIKDTYGEVSFIKTLNKNIILVENNRFYGSGEFLGNIIKVEEIK
jgi:hypothetical protein